VYPVRTVAPTETPVTLAEVKAHLRVDHSDEDELISGLIDAATAHIDGYSGILGRALVTQSWKIEVDDWDDLDLPLSPVASITSVKYYDGSNAQQTLAATVYQLVNRAGGSCAELKYGQTWPVTYTRADAIEVIFVAGYGAASAVPQAIKLAMLLLIGHWYANREAVSTDAGSPLPLAVESLLAPYRRVGV